MTARIQIQLASLAVGTLCLFGTTPEIGAFELLDQLLGKGAAAGCGCDTGKSNAGQKDPGKGAHGAKSPKQCDGCCSVSTPVLDAMTDLTRTVKCRVNSLPRFELPCIHMPSIDLGSLFPCHRCSCAAGKGKGDGKLYTTSPMTATPGPAYHSPGDPVVPPPAPIVDEEA
jgi:hypothetical protein